jgi:hypothetical protein
MKMSLISRKKIELEDRVLSEGYNTTERDLAEAQELVNSYIDELERLEDSAVPSPVSNIEPVVTFALVKWYPND